MRCELLQTQVVDGIEGAHHSTSRLGDDGSGPAIPDEAVDIDIGGELGGHRYLV